MRATVSEQGINLIKQHEGLRLTSYVCPAGKWTIGYGHTRTAAPSLRITELQAEQLLRSDLSVTEATVRTLKVPLTQGQFDALVSFVFNVGTGAFRNSTLRKLLLAGAPALQVASEFHKWVFGGGRRLPGLVKRRQDEARLFIS